MRLPQSTVPIAAPTVAPDPGLQWRVGEVRLAGGGGVPAPKPGCWFVGTQCRIGYQTCKFCCGDGQSYSQQCGWCIGWYDAPPCVGRQF